ncbi:ABC transporter permease [Mesorhizobium shangrilense]|uniref:ABC transporter permease n=1 Tax=Mesorhizobium shangrilense TaxID=460060 RepID=A0ABV2DS43_9HYPH
MLLVLAAFAGLGRLVIDVSTAAPLSAPASSPPTSEYLFGVDAQGRNLIAVMIQGTYLTVRTGLIAGAIGTLLGAALGFVAAYFGGWTDRIISWLIDVSLTVPALLFLVMISSVVQTGLTSMGMALIIAALAWRVPARQIRSQMLVMRTSMFVDVARISGEGPFRIILAEITPNLLPFLMSAFVAAMADAILASIGMEAMGLGPQNEPTLGMTIYWLMTYSAFLSGMWWWILPPVLILMTLFVGLYFVNVGLDELSNPRLRRLG